MGAVGFEPTSLLGRRRYSIPVRLTVSATSPVWVAIAWMGGQDGGARSRKAFAVRSPSPGPAAALLAGRGGAPAAFAGACTEWTFKERDARACAYANFSDSQGVGRSVEGQDRQPVSRDVLPRLSSTSAKHPALGGLADLLEGKGH